MPVSRIFFKGGNHDLRQEAAAENFLGGGKVFDGFRPGGQSGENFLPGGVIISQSLLAKGQPVVDVGRLGGEEAGVGSVGGKIAGGQGPAIISVEGQGLFQVGYGRKIVFCLQLKLPKGGGKVRQAGEFSGSLPGGGQLLREGIFQLSHTGEADAVHIAFGAARRQGGADGQPGIAQGFRIIFQAQIAVRQITVVAGAFSPGGNI